MLVSTNLWKDITELNMKPFKAKETIINGIHEKRYYFCGINYFKRTFSNSKKKTYLLNIRISKSYKQSPEYKTHNPLISVIVASYNYEKYITTTLDSLVAQTYKNFEVIVVDDGSKDSSVKIIKSYAEKHPFIKLYQHKNGKNMGLPATIQLGIKKAAGEYIAFCESDDYWTPDHLQEKVNVINRTGLAFIVNNVTLFDSPTKAYENYIKHGLESFVKGKSFCNIINNNPIATWSCAMIRTDVLRSCNFDSVIPAWVDWWVYRQILLKYPLYYINKRLTFWRIHNSYNAPDNSSKYNQQIGYFVEQNNKLLGTKTHLSKNYETISNSTYWDEKYYLSHYKNQLNGMLPIEHYLNIGWKQGCNPSEKFDTDAYLSLNSDIYKAGVHPLIHYENHGKKEKRKIYPVQNNSKHTIEGFLKKIDNEYKNKKIIILLSHELSLTGAPRALLNMAISLKKQGVIPVIFAWQNGDIEKEIIANDIELIIDPKLHLNCIKKDSNICNLLSKSHLILFNTLVSLQFIDVFPNVKTPKIAWLHEGFVSYNNLETTINFQAAFKTLKEIYSVGDYSKSFADRYITDSKKSHILLYGIDDIKPSNQTSPDKTTATVKFILPGTISERKAHDIVLKAIKKLPKSIQKNAIIYIAGPCGNADIEKNIKKMAKTNKNIKYMHSLPHDKLMKLFAEVDVVMCPSRDDPMPIVCTEAFALRKTVIVSKNTGTAAFIKNGENGFVVPAEDINALANTIEYIVRNKNKLTTIGKKARKIYEQNFTNHVFDKNVTKILNDF